MADLRRDMNNLRKELDTDRKLRGAAGFEGTYIGDGTQLPAIDPNRQIAAYGQTVPQDAVAEEIKDYDEPMSLNLNDLGKQMVEKALERNNGNRKKAAQELGISDRTLYRRIKQYGLDQ